MSLLGIIDISKYNIGIVKPSEGNTTNSYTIIGYENLKPALNGDKVELAGSGSLDLNYKVIKVIERAKHTDIPGILELRSKVIYGMNRRGVPIYLFKPSNKAYPSFLVASTLKRDLGNQYVLVNFHEWPSNCLPTASNLSTISKFPSGTMVTVLGPIGDLTTEYEHVIHKYGLSKPTFKNLIKRQPDLGEKIRKDKATLINQDEPQHLRMDLTDLNVFSIDPEGCEDIDDALHIRIVSPSPGSSTIKTEYIEVGVHIADVAQWIPEGSPFDLIARSGLSTVYAPHKRVDILPAEYATDICSLKPMQMRYAITTLFHFDMNGQLISHKFALSTIKSKYALSYERADALLAAEHSNHDLVPSLALFKDLVTKVATHVQQAAQPSGDKMHNSNKNSKAEPITDFSHAIVETFMILTNKVVAETLCKELPSQTILRTHKGAKKEQVAIYQGLQIRPDDKESKLLKAHLDIVTMESAEYILFKLQGNLSGDSQSEPEKYSHAGLGLGYYTHFTSPIRRYVDLINHRLIRRIILNLEASDKSDNNTDVLDKVCREFNDLSKRINKAEREFALLALIAQWEFANTSLITSAYITELGEDSPSVTIFIPKYNLSKKVRAHHKNIDTLKEWSCNSKTLTIKDKATEVITQYSLLQKIKIEIIPNMQSEIMSKKIKINIYN